jgi:hypothetical protein
MMMMMIHMSAVAGGFLLDLGRRLGRSAPEGAVGFWRDSSGRLTFDVPGMAAADFPAVCRGIR